MEHGQMVLVACTIEAGAFSGERVFRLTLADGGLNTRSLAGSLLLLLREARAGPWRATALGDDPGIY